MNIGTLLGNPALDGFSETLRARIALLLAALLWLPALAIADDSVNTVSPSSFYVFATEEYVTITGNPAISENEWCNRLKL